MRMNIDHDEANSDIRAEIRHKIPIIAAILCVSALVVIWHLAYPTSYVPKTATCNDGSLPTPKTHLTDLGMEQRFICPQAVD